MILSHKGHPSLLNTCFLYKKWSEHLNIINIYLP